MAFFNDRKKFFNKAKIIVANLNITNIKDNIPSLLVAAFIIAALANSATNFIFTSEKINIKDDKVKVVASKVVASNEENLKTTQKTSDDMIQAGDRYRPRQNSEAVSRGTYVSRDDLYLMAKVIEGEAADEPMVGKVAVGAVIINRTENPEFPKSISKVIYQDYAFECVSNGQYHRPLTEESVKAAQLALNGWDPTHGAYYYWNPYKKVSPWVWSRPIVTQIGNHVFAY